MRNTHNIQLPLNFNSPYKATSIIDFWKRWHITLTNFVTTYLYTPLLRSFSRITFTYSLLAIFASMVISGFWHGSGWTFVIWGGMHGAALVINHLWRRKKLWMPPLIGWLITINFVNLSFVFFRSKSMEEAVKIIKGMVGLNGVMLPHAFSRFGFLQENGIIFGTWLNGIQGNYLTLGYLFIALLIVVMAKNSVQMTENFQPSFRNAAILFLMINAACWTLAYSTRVSEFLYFQF